MSHPLISICIPTFNGALYLRECLDSCLAQTFTDFELIVCDDGSTDATLAILEDYRSRHSFIQLYRNEKNQGLAGNWNRCLQLAKGGWIKLLFQDDAMEPNCLQRFAENMQPADKLLMCRRHFVLDMDVTEDEKEYYTHRVKTLENTGHYQSNEFAAQLISKLAAANISLNFIGEPSLALFKKDVLAKLGEFDTELKQICDLEFFLRIGSEYGLRYIPEQLCRFRIHAHSTTEKNITSKSYHLNYLEALLFALKLLAKPQFAAFRKALSATELFKLKLYIKYKSYLAFKGIDSAQDEAAYRRMEKEYKGLFFKNRDRLYLKLLAAVKS